MKVYQKKWCWVGEAKQKFSKSASWRIKKFLRSRSQSASWRSSRKVITQQG
ncbi:MAG: hypothetical protein AAB696_01680 [Patescibacteria group bacterium]